MMTTSDSNLTYPSSQLQKPFSQFRGSRGLFGTKVQSRGEVAPKGNCFGEASLPVDSHMVSVINNSCYFQTSATPYPTNTPCQVQDLDEDPAFMAVEKVKQEETTGLSSVDSGNNSMENGIEQDFMSDGSCDNYIEAFSPEDPMYDCMYGDSMERSQSYTNSSQSANPTSMAITQLDNIFRDKINLEVEEFRYSVQQLLDEQHHKVLRVLSLAPQSNEQISSRTDISDGRVLEVISSDTNERSRPMTSNTDLEAARMEAEKNKCLVQLFTSTHIISAALRRQEYNVM